MTYCIKPYNNIFLFLSSPILLILFILPFLISLSVLPHPSNFLILSLASCFHFSTPIPPAVF